MALPHPSNPPAPRLREGLVSLDLPRVPFSFWQTLHCGGPASVVELHLPPPHVFLGASPASWPGHSSWGRARERGVLAPLSHGVVSTSGQACWVCSSPPCQSAPREGPPLFNHLLLSFGSLSPPLSSSILFPFLLSYFSFLFPIFPPTPSPFFLFFLASSPSQLPCLLDFSRVPLSLQLPPQAKMRSHSE